MTEDEMVGWHHRLNGHGFGWTLGVGDGQGGLACCNSWGYKESDTTERLNWVAKSYPTPATPWTAACPLLCPPLFPKVFYNSCPLSWCCHPTISSSVVPFSSCPQSFPSIRVFSNELALCIRWPKYWSFSISPSSEYSGLISFRIDWFDLAVQRTLKSLLQHHNLKASCLFALT